MKLTAHYRTIVPGPQDYESHESFHTVELEIDDASTDEEVAALYGRLDHMCQKAVAAALAHVPARAAKPAGPQAVPSAPSRPQAAQASARPQQASGPSSGPSSGPAAEEPQTVDDLCSDWQSMIQGIAAVTGISDQRKLDEDMYHSCAWWQAKDGRNAAPSFKTNQTFAHLCVSRAKDGRETGLMAAGATLRRAQEALEMLQAGQSVVMHWASWIKTGNEFSLKLQPWTLQPLGAAAVEEGISPEEVLF